MAKNKKFKTKRSKNVEIYESKLEVKLRISKKNLIIEISDPESRKNAEARFTQKKFFDDVFQSGSFKSTKKENGIYYFTFKNRTSILKILDTLKKDYPEVYQSNLKLDKYYKSVKRSQKKLLKLRRKKSAQGDLSYIFPEDFKERAEPVSGSINEVFKLKLSKEEAKKLGFKSYDAYFKYEPNLVDGHSNEYQAVSAALFELFLGSDRVPVTRVVYDEQGIRKGTISEALLDWKPLSKFIEEKANENIKNEIKKKKISAGYPWFPTYSYLSDEQRDFSRKWYYPEEMAQKLVNDGLIDVYVVNYFLANRDAHFDNVGYHNGKIGAIDFDKVLALIFNWRIDKNSKKDVIAEWKIDSKDIGNGFVNPTIANPPRWLNTRGFSYDNAFNSGHDTTPALAKRLSKAEKYFDKQFFSFLKIIVTPLDDIKNCITSFEKNKKHQDKIYEYLKNRKQELYVACYSNDDFSDWLIDNVERILQRLRTYFIDYYENTSLPVHLSVQKIEERLDKVEALYQSVVTDIQKSYEDSSSDDS